MHVQIRQDVPARRWAEPSKHPAEPFLANSISRAARAVRPPSCPAVGFLRLEPARRHLEPARESSLPRSFARASWSRPLGLAARREASSGSP